MKPSECVNGVSSPVEGNNPCGLSVRGGAENGSLIPWLKDLGSGGLPNNGLQSICCSAPVTPPLSSPTTIRCSIPYNIKIEWDKDTSDGFQCGFLNSASASPWQMQPQQSAFFSLQLSGRSCASHGAFHRAGPWNQCLYKGRGRWSRFIMFPNLL